MRPFVLVAMLAACGAQPAPQFLGAERFDAVRDGRAYVLYRKGNAAEVIRLGWAGPSEMEGIQATMVALVPELTGCQIDRRSWRGDAGEMRGRLRCPRAKPAA